MVLPPESPERPAPGHRKGVGQWWLDLSLRAKGLTVIAVPLVALMLVTLASLDLQRNERQARSEALTAHTLCASAGQLVLDAVNAESGVRDYAATGNRLLLAPYRAALARIGADRKALRAAAAAEGDTRQQRVATATSVTVLAQLARLRSAVSAGASVRGLRPALEQQKITLDRLRHQVARLGAGPAALEVAQRQKIESLEDSIGALEVAALIVGLLVGLAGVALASADVGRRILAHASNAGRLGEGRPLEPLRPARDEVGQVAESHLRATALLARRDAELSAARDEALRATQAKTSFLSHTSHELRTPLNSILGFTQLLELSDLSDEDRDSTERILGAGRHLLALINDLIDIARIESGELSLSLGPVGILPVIGDVSRLMSPLAAERSIEIVQNGPSPALAAHADRHRLRQILVNLVSNAVKYNRPAGRITISVEAEDPGQVSVIVADTGPGLSEEDLDRIFVPFQRLDAEFTDIEGSGIGLPLARTLAEAMGGQLTASSVPGTGSQFTLTLPRARDLDPDPDLAGGPAPPAGSWPLAWAGSSGAAGTVLSVLYVEDNPANAEVISRFLAGRPGITLHSARSGRAGLECAARLVPDVILLDVHLPDLDGEAVLAGLRGNPATAGIPVIMLSAEASPRVRRHLLDQGALAYLTKPVRLAELGGVLDSLEVPVASGAAAR